MSESAVILEGEVARRFNPVDKLRATNQDSSVSDWVPSDTLDLGSLMASENTLYLANLDDDCDAYEEVEVDVSTDLEDADDLTKATTKITGKDPNLDPNNDYAAGVDENGNLTKEMIPAAIHIVVKPRKLKYEEGETLDFTGIHVYLMDGNNKRYTDDNYPTGEIPFDELMFPVTIAESSSGQIASSDLIPDGVPFGSTGSIGYISTYGQTKDQHFTQTFSVDVEGAVTLFLMGMQSYAYLFASKNSDAKGIITDSWGGGSSERTMYRQITYDGKTAYYNPGTVGWGYAYRTIESCSPDAGADMFSSVAAIAWTMLYGNITGGNAIPVQWIRSDGAILEDTFEIEVGESEEGQEQPDPWGGYADVSWGGHHYNFNRRLVPPVQYSNGYCWRQQAGEYTVEYTVEQAANMGWLILIR